MFDRISGVYDPMNAVISGFQEPRWRRALVRALGLRPGASALDVACGTGAVSVALARCVGVSGRVVGVDLSPRMIARARRRWRDYPQLEFRPGDALELPVESGEFDAATIAFGMRNLADYQRAFAEMVRSVRPGGVVACLEIGRPEGTAGRLGLFWFDRVVPAIGRLVGQRAAYAYLVESTRHYPRPEAVAELMRAAGLARVDWRSMAFGTVTLHLGHVPFAGTQPGPDAGGIRNCPRQARRSLPD
jgi:demethylmenaquinone methyltransferase / 2-methoxy-6-polyprenyl-1,4-benzoquinol methylase